MNSIALSILILVVTAVTLVITHPTDDVPALDSIPGKDLNATIADLVAQLRAHVMKIDRAHEKFDEGNEAYHRPLSSHQENKHTEHAMETDPQTKSQSVQNSENQSQVTEVFIQATEEFLRQTFAKAQIIAKSGQLNATASPSINNEATTA